MCLGPCSSLGSVLCDGWAWDRLWCVCWCVFQSVVVLLCCVRMSGLFVWTGRAVWPLDFFKKMYAVDTAVQHVQKLCVHAVGYCGRWSPAVLEGSIDMVCCLLVGCLSCGR